MYFRIKNWLDARALSVRIHRMGMDDTVADRIEEIVTILDSNYGGALRSVHADGGYVLFFETREVYEELLEPLQELYHINDEQREYLDYIGKDDLWCEVLFIIGEENLVMVFPRE